MIQLVCGAESRCLKVCTDGPLTDTDNEEDDVVVDHVKMCFMCLDVGIISYGLCSAQSQSDAGPL